MNGNRTESQDHQAGAARHGGHGWMIACCIPMFIVAAALIATGATNPSFLLLAVGCVAMMALMMRSMSRTDGSHH